MLKAFGERKDGHAQFCQEVARSERAFHALTNDTAARDQWESDYRPSYAMQVCDTVVANLVDDRTRYRVRPRPRIDDPEEVERHIKGARAHELNLDFVLDQDHWNEKKAASALQVVIAGLSFTKQHWSTELALSRSLVARQDPVVDDYGNVTGYQLVQEEVEREEVVKDDATIDVCRVEDVMWEEGAVELQRSPWIIHRVPATPEEIARLKKAGVYRDTDQLDASRRESGGNLVADEFSAIEQELWQDNRFRNRHEILEYWCKENGALRCITIGDRKAVLADRRFVFAHREYPFVAWTTRPNRFRIPGRSIMSTIQDVQEYLWSLMGQRLDNLQLINNAIFAFRDDLMDREVFDFYPGAMWPVQGDVEKAVKMFSPDPSVALISLQAEALMKGDLQNLTGGMPFMSGTSSDTIDQKTATGVSIVTTLAQRMLSWQKQGMYWAEERIGQQMVSLCQQFTQAERLIPIIGADGAFDFERISPDVLAGNYRVVIEPVADSLIRQERRAEAGAMMQILIQAAPILAALGVSINGRTLVEDFLRSYDIEDVERYVTAAPQALPPGPASPPGQGGAQPQPGIGGGGPMQTAPSAYGPTSPSNEQSLSGVSALQQMMSQYGGAANGG